MILVMNEDCKLLMCDIDGTLVEKGGNPLPMTAKALKDFHEKGILIGLASGRPVDQRLIDKFKEWELDFDVDVLIGFNGCQTWNRFDRIVRTENTLERDEVRRLLDLLWDLDLNIVAYENGYDKVLVKRWDWMVEASQARNHSNVAVSDQKDFLRIDTCKLELHYDMKYEEDLMDLVRKHPSDRSESIRTYPGTLEFMYPGVNKGLALKRVCEELSIPLSQVIACGDMDNDKEMLKVAGTSICLLNGSEDSKKAAGFITDKDVAHDGLGEFLLEHFL